jgi:hypothetical protein
MKYPVAEDPVIILHVSHELHAGLQALQLTAK